MMHEAIKASVVGERHRAVKILAQSIFRELRNNGYTPGQIVGLSSELIGLITTELKPDHGDNPAR
jgi:hypothetical protein